MFAKAGPITRHALEFYSKLWVPYPFPQLTLQDGPSAGMEYPMVINSNQGAADHEAAHQWWPMMVGTNETWYGWMDEGFNEYMNILSDADAAGTPADSRRPRSELRAVQRQRRGTADDVVRQQRRDMYGFQTYSKDAADALDARRHRRRRGGAARDARVHESVELQAPVAWDYMFFMNNALKQDLGWFWYYWLLTTESVDGSIAERDDERRPRRP